jgi:hypothetical protein
VDAARAVCSNRREEVPAAEANEGILHLASVSSVEDGPCSGAIAAAQNIAFLEYWAEGGGSEGIIMGLVAIRVVTNRVTTVAREAERRIWLRCQPYCNVGRFWKVKHFDLPVVNLVEFGKRKVGLHT